MSNSSFRLEMKNITKSFPGVLAVDDVSIRAEPGEIFSLVGENGAGKTTLMNVLNGVLPADSGEIFIEGEKVEVDSPRKALDLGISMIHQELALIPQLTVGQNIYLGREPRRNVPGLVDWEELYRLAEADLENLGINIPVKAPIKELTVAQQQLVEIAKALSYQSRIIVLDEPTSSLTDRESEVLFDLMRSLREQDVTMIYISHRIEEVIEISDRIAVLRDGQLVGVNPVDELTPQKVVQMMVGRDIDEFYTKSSTAEPGALILEARNLTSGKLLKDVSVSLHKGEIVGLAGLVGAGRTKLARVLYGADPLESGEIKFEGKSVQIDSPRDAIHLGIGLVPEDRKDEGLFLGQSVRSNVAVTLFNELIRFGFIQYRRVEKRVRDIVKRLNIRTPSLEQRVRNLSGGNQQKVVFGRWLALSPKVLILDEPTRGVDVGAKAEIHALMDELASQGISILMISSELPEVLGNSDRILVMREGHLVGEFSREESTQDLIMQAATGQIDESNSA